MHQVTAIVLAAGLSSRMDETFKLTLSFKDHTILEEVICNILGAKIDEIIVVTGHLEDQVMKILKKYPRLRFVHNEEYELGITSSIQRGIQNASRKSLGFMICLGDLPFISMQEYLHITNTFLNLEENSTRIVRPCYKNIPGNPVLFGNKFREEILRNTSIKGCKGLIKTHPEALYKIEMKTDSITRDIDTLIDYKGIQKKG